VLSPVQHATWWQQSLCQLNVQRSRKTSARQLDSNT
jgi:hypothetical protein